MCIIVIHTLVSFCFQRVGSLGTRNDRHRFGIVSRSFLFEGILEGGTSFKASTKKVPGGWICTFGKDFESIMCVLFCVWFKLEYMERGKKAVRQKQVR